MLMAKSNGVIRVGIGGWTYEPWRGVFYPKGLAQKNELSFAARAVTAIEINGTFYSTFGRDTWKKWRAETPEGFVFSVKASRFCTNRKVLADAAGSIEKFIGQGLAELGDRLGPVAWQLGAAKKLDLDDVGAFLALLPRKVDGLRLRHALEVRHASFCDPAFYALARKHEVAIVYAGVDDREAWPVIDEPTADFTYARLMTSRAEHEAGHTAAQLDAYARQAEAWRKRGDVFMYFISADKERNPAAAQALLGRLR
jgi:uncharacterized protein YecE (DUF72 family)